IAQNRANRIRGGLRRTVSAAPSSTPERVEDFLARMAVLRQPGPVLEGPDGVSGTLADLAVDLAVVIAQGGKTLLQFLGLRRAEPGEGPAPVVHQPTVAGNLVGKKADGQRVAV